uniref:RNase H type-1 domain-containing protein n=1 Tax=Quercus lobata TaxID=97700 RepID=A0A7N2KVT5_QUELO
MSKRVKTNIPIQAEAEAINLATCVAVNCGFEFVVVESDAKACIDALKVPFDEVPWRISSITADTLLLVFHGKKFVFRWSPRESNKAAHVLASWCLGKNVSGCFGQGYAPRPFLDVINSNLLAAVAAA